MLLFLYESFNIKAKKMQIQHIPGRARYKSVRKGWNTKKARQEGRILNVACNIKIPNKRKLVFSLQLVDTSNFLFLKGFA